MGDELVLRQHRATWLRGTGTASGRRAAGRPRTWYRPCDSLHTCRVPLKPRFLLRRLAVRQITRALPVDCRQAGRQAG